MVFGDEDLSLGDESAVSTTLAGPSPYRRVTPPVRLVTALCCTSAVTIEAPVSHRASTCSTCAPNPRRSRGGSWCWT